MRQSVFEKKKLRQDRRSGADSLQGQKSNRSLDRPRFRGGADSLILWRSGSCAQLVQISSARVDLQPFAGSTRAEAG